MRFSLFEGSCQRLSQRRGTTRLLACRQRTSSQHYWLWMHESVYLFDASLWRSIWAEGMKPYHLVNEFQSVETTPFIQSPAKSECLSPLWKSISTTWLCACSGGETNRKLVFLRKSKTIGYLSSHTFDRNVLHALSSGSAPLYTDCWIDQ